MAQSTRPASANGSARQDTRAAGRPARSSADGAVRSLPEPRPRAQAMALPGRSRRQPCTRAGSRRRHLVRRNLEPRASVGRGPGRRGGRRRISSMICGSTCAGCARCPTCCHGRQARAPCVARCARKWPGPCSRCRGRAIGTSSRWKCCRSSAMPIRISIRKPRPRGLAPAPRSRTTRCTPTCRPNASRPCCACSGNAARDPRRHGRARAPVAVSRARPPPRGWDAARARLDNAADQGPRRQHAARIRVKRLRYASEALLLLSPSRKLERYVKALADVQGALGSAQDFRHSRRAGARCVSACRPAGWRVDKATKRPCGAAQGPAMASPASRRLLRRPSFWAQASRGQVARRLGPAGAEAPRATA